MTDDELDELAWEMGQKFARQMNDQHPGQSAAERAENFRLAVAAARAALGARGLVAGPFRWPGE